jgi:hypothetical protein
MQIEIFEHFSTIITKSYNIKTSCVLTLCVNAHMTWTIKTWTTKYEQHEQQWFLQQIFNKYLPTGSTDRLLLLNIIIITVKITVNNAIVIANWKQWKCRHKWRRHETLHARRIYI